MKLRLIEIRADGSPARCPGLMPPAARDVLEGTTVMYETGGFTPPWIGYLADRDGDVVGACAFKGPPHEGRVEIAYHTFPEYEKRGIAREMARQLLALAAQADPQVVVTAQTLPQESASTKILRGLGFKLEGPVESEEDGTVWQWSREAGHV